MGRKLGIAPALASDAKCFFLSPSPKRSDEAGVIYHALNRGNARGTIFHKQADFEAFRFRAFDMFRTSRQEHWRPSLANRQRRHSKSLSQINELDLRLPKKIRGHTF